MALTVRFRTPSFPSNLVGKNSKMPDDKHRRGQSFAFVVAFSTQNDISTIGVLVMRFIHKLLYGVGIILKRTL